MKFGSKSKPPQNEIPQQNDEEKSNLVTAELIAQATGASKPLKPKIGIYPFGDRSSFFRMMLDEGTRQQAPEEILNVLQTLFNHRQNPSESRSS